MPNFTREKRLERIEKDPGDPEDTVYLNPSEYTRAYHKRDCPKLNGVEPRELTRKVAQDRIKSPCVTCIIGRDRISSVGGGISELERLIRAGEAEAWVGGSCD